MPNPNYKETITIFNCLKAKDSGALTDVWHKTVLTNCFYKADMGQGMSGTTSDKPENVVVRIPGDKPYLPYAQWIDADKTDYFTLRQDDILIKGTVTESITGTTPNTATEIMNAYRPDAIRIKSVADNRGFPGAHFKVGG